MRIAGERQMVGFGRKIAANLKGGDVVLLYGDLGAGKTTLIRGMADYFGIEDIVSPTFTLMQVYKISPPASLREALLAGNIQYPISNLVHIDTYRLKDEKRLLEIGAQDYVGNPEAVCVIEWPENLKNIISGLKTKAVKIKFDNDNSRIVEIDWPDVAENKKVSAVVPAYNESSTIVSVIKALKQSPVISEVIVVDDGSTDDTAKKAVSQNVKVISLPKNQGKASAMEAGVQAADNSVIFFTDADNIGLNAKRIEKIVVPVKDGDYSMFVGIRRRRTYWLNKILHLLPLIAGDRALTRELWNHVPAKYKKGFQIEIALNYFAKTSGHRMGHCLLTGVRHVIKEKKRGILMGFLSRIKMCAEIVWIAFKLYVL